MRLFHRITKTVGFIIAGAFVICILMVILLGTTGIRKTYRELTKTYSQTDVTSFISDALFKREYTFAGAAPTTVIKWTEPEITYSVEGKVTTEHLDAIRAAVKEIAKVRGLPRLTQVDDHGMIEIHIADDIATQALAATNSSALSVVSCDPVTSAIQAGRVCLRAEYETDEWLQHVVLEELVQSLGMENDTAEYPDSITYQWPSNRTSLSPLDIAALTCLYSDRIPVGMTKEEAVEAIPAWVRQTIYG
jgi:uncharacterized membrane protein